MKWIADNLLMPLSGILVIAIIFFAWRTHKSEKPSRQRNRMKRSMLVSIISCFAVVIAVISMDPTENNSSSDKVSDVPQHKSIHHSNTWKIQHEMPQQMKDYIGHATIKPNGFFEAKPYTLNLVINDQYPMQPQHEYVDVQQALRFMKKYDFNDFNNVSITIQGQLMDDQGNKTSYVPLEKYNFKGKNIMEINDPTQMSFSDLKNLSNDYWQRNNVK